MQVVSKKYLRTLLKNLESQHREIVGYGLAGVPPDEAIQQISRIIEVKEQVYGRRHREVAEDLFCMADYYKHAGTPQCPHLGWWVGKMNDPMRKRLIRTASNLRRRARRMLNSLEKSS